MRAMWKKRVIIMICMLMGILLPAGLVEAEQTGGSFESALEFPSTNGRLTTTGGNVYYKYTAGETSQIDLDISGSQNARIYIYNGEKEEVVRGGYGYLCPGGVDVNLVVQKGDTWYFEIYGENAVTFNYSIKDYKNYAIKKITVEQYPNLTDYIEFFQESEGKRYYSDYMYDLKIKVEWEDGHVTRVGFPNDYGHWDDVFHVDSDWIYREGLSTHKEGTYPMPVYYYGKRIPLFITVKSLKDIPVQKVSLEKNVQVDFKDGGWKAFSFTPEESGYYDILYSTTSLYSMRLCEPEQGVIMYRVVSDSVTKNSYAYSEWEKYNYLVEGRTYTFYVGVPLKEKQMKFKVKKSFCQQYPKGFSIDSVPSVSYIGSAYTPTPGVRYNGKDISKEANVNYEYYFNQEPGAALVKVKGLLDGEEFTLYTTFYICQKIDGAQVTLNDSTYTGSPIIPTVVVTKNGMELKQDKDYQITSENNVDAGEATVKITGMGKYEGVIQKTFNIKKATWNVEAPDTIIKKRKSKSFDLGVKADGQVSYTTANHKVATVTKEGKVSIKGYGKTYITATAVADRNHEEVSKKIAIIVTCKDGKIKSVKKVGKGQAVVKLQKVSDAQGYEISYSTDKSFSKNVKKTTTKSLTTTLKKLKRKETYYVRVRTYRKVKGQKLYSEYSKVKSVTVK